MHLAIKLNSSTGGSNKKMFSKKHARSLEGERGETWPNMLIHFSRITEAVIWPPRQAPQLQDQHCNYNESDKQKRKNFWSGSAAAVDPTSVRWKQLPAKLTRFLSNFLYPALQVAQHSRPYYLIWMSWFQIFWIWANTSEQKSEMPLRPRWTPHLFGGNNYQQSLHVCSATFSTPLCKLHNTHGHII